MEPVFVSVPLVLVIGAEMIRPRGEAPDVVIVAPPGFVNATDPPAPAEIVGVKARLSLAAVTGTAAVRDKLIVPAPTVGVAAPALANWIAANVLLPVVRFSVEPPLSMAVLLGSIWPPKPFWVTVALLIVSPPAGTTMMPALAALRLTVPLLYHVPAYRCCWPAG